VTMFFAIVDTGLGRIRYANAGHPAGFVLDSRGRVEKEMGRTGLPLGVRTPRGSAPTVEVPLQAGNLIVLYTDGVTEIRNPEGEFFDTEGLLAAVRSRLDRPVAEIARAVMDEARSFARGRLIEDDMSVVIGRYRG